MKKVVLFVEGATELEFYQAVIRCFHGIQDGFKNTLVESHDLKGIGNFKNAALRKFQTIIRENPDYDYILFLCIDTDIFNQNSKNYNRIPPFDKKRLQNQLIENGAKKVFYIEAKESIEDWFLSDLLGVVSFLHLPKKTKRPSGNGQDAIKQLFKKANKVYVKGTKVEGFISKLNIQSIVTQHCSSLRKLCSALGCKCNEVCHK